VNLAAVLLAGGQSARLGGTDKAMVSVGGRTLLARCVGSVRALEADPVVVVGPMRAARDFPKDVLVAQEQPAGAGPAAATLSGLRALEVDDECLVVIMAADLPLAREALVAVVEGARQAVQGGRDGAMAQADGHDQYLLMCVRRGSVLHAVGTEDFVNDSMRRLIELLDLDRVETSMLSVLDTDTWPAVVQARDILREEISMQQTTDWSTVASAIAGIQGTPIDVDAILDLARDAAHGVERPAAPVTTFILGYAAGAQSLDAEAVAALAASLGRAALEFGVEE